MTQNSYSPGLRSFFKAFSNQPGATASGIVCVMAGTSSAG